MSDLNRYMPRTLLLIAIFSVLFPCSGFCKDRSSVRSGGRESVKSRLSSIKKHIQEKKEEMKLSRQKAAEVLNEIDGLDRRSASVQSKIADLSVKKKQLADDIAAVQKKISSLQNSISQKRNTIKKRLVATFKLQQIGYLQVLLAADSPVDMEKRYTLINYIIKNDRQDVQSLLSEEDALKAAQDTYKGQRSSLDALAADLNSQRTDLLKTRAQKNRMLADIRRSTESTRKILQELQRSEVSLQHALNSLSSVSGQKTGFAGMRGKLPFPIRGKIEDIFGKTTDSMINAKGILFEVRTDADIRAVYPGKVVWTEWLKGYGNTIIVDHGDRYFTIYAHVGDSNVQVGSRVTQGEMIGTVGDAGLGKSRSLYFEIRHGEQALNPRSWLR